MLNLHEDEIVLVKQDGLFLYIGTSEAPNNNLGGHVI